MRPIALGRDLSYGNIFDPNMAGDEYQIMKIESETALHVMLRVAPVSSYGRGGSHWEEILISLNFAQFKNNFTPFFIFLLL